MGSVSAMLTEVRRHIGYREGRTTPFGIWYGDQVGSNAYDGAPWCDMFLAYCASKTGNLPAVGRFAYTPSHVNWFKGLGRWHTGKSGIRAGDIVFFDWDGGVVDHVGIVEKVLADGRVQTIEGNTSNACLRRVRSGSIEGYGRPAYSGATAPAPPPPPKPGTKAPAYPLRSGHWFGPESSDPRNHSGYWPADRPHIAKLRDRFQARGWKVADGDRYDKTFAGVVKQFQAEKRLTADGLTGPITWRAAWEFPIT